MTTLTDIQLFSPTKRPTLWSNTQLFLRYFSVSSKVFYPVAYIMNGIQHLTTPTCLKFCLGIMLFIWPQLLKIWPQLSPVWPQLLSFGERDGDNFFTARANPVYPFKDGNHHFSYIKFVVCKCCHVFKSLKGCCLVQCKE